MSTIKLNAAPSAVQSRIAKLENGNYAFVGFHKHTMNIKKADNSTSTIETFAPVLAKLGPNNEPIALFAVNRSDLTRLENPRIEWDKPTSTYNNTGAFVEQMSQTVNREGYFNDALWMNVALPRFRSSVLATKVTEFAGISSRGTIWRGAKVYDINFIAGQTFDANLHRATLNTLMANKGWSADDCPGFDGQNVTFTYEKDGAIHTVNVSADGKLLA